MMSFGLLLLLFGMDNGDILFGPDNMKTSINWIMTDSVKESYQYCYDSKCYYLTNNGDELYLRDAISTKGYDQIQISFGIYDNPNNIMNIGDTCQIYYSIDNSLSWIYVDGYGNGNRMPNNITIVSLNKIANDNIDGIRIRFFNSLQSIGNKPCYIDYVSITGKPLPSKEATQNPIQNTPRMVTNQDNSKTLFTLLLVTAVVLVVIFCIGSVLFYKIYALKLKELKRTESSTAKVIKKYHNPNNNKSHSFSVDIIDPTTSSFPTPHNSNHSDITKPQTHNSANTTESNKAKYIHKRYQRNPANSPSKISNEQKLESLAEGLKTDTFNITNKTNRDRKNIRIPKKQIRHNKKKGYRPHTISDSHSDYKESSKIGNGEPKTFQVISSAKYNTLLQQEMRLQSIINNAMKGNNNNNDMIPMNKNNRNITDGQSDTASIATVTPNRGRRGTDITSVLSGNGTHGSSTCTSISPSGSSTYQSTNNLSALSSQSSISTVSTNSQSTASTASTASTQSFTSSASSSLSHANTDDSSTDSNDSSDESNPSEQAKIIYKE